MRKRWRPRLVDRQSCRSMTKTARQSLLTPFAPTTFFSTPTRHCIWEREQWQRISSRLLTTRTMRTDDTFLWPDQEHWHAAILVWDSMWFFKKGDCIYRISSCYERLVEDHFAIGHVLRTFLIQEIRSPFGMVRASPKVRENAREKTHRLLFQSRESLLCRSQSYINLSPQKFLFFSPSILLHNIILHTIVLHLHTTSSHYIIRHRPPLWLWHHKTFTSTA